MRKILLIIISLLMAVVVDAQTLVGLQGYFAKAKLATDSAQLNDLQTMVNSYGGGVSIKHFELGPIGLQAEINFEKSGFGFQNDTLSSIHYYQDLTYVSIAPLMQLDLGKHAFHVVGSLGPYVNVLIDAPEPETTSQAVLMPGFSKMYTSAYNRFTYGLLGDVGVAFATKAGVFQFTGRAFIGMTKLLRFEGIALFNSTVPKSFGVALHYFVPFGEEKYATKKEKVAQDTLVSDLEILSDSLNAVSDSLSLSPAQDSSKVDSLEVKDLKEVKESKKDKAKKENKKNGKKDKESKKEESAEIPENKLDTDVNESE